MLQTETKTNRHRSWLALCLGLGLLLTFAASTASALNKRPLRWAGKGFSADSDAVEHLTIRGTDSKGHDIFLRWSMANAAQRDGDLEVTVRVESNKGTLYAKKTYSSKQFRVDSAQLGLTAGENSLKVDGDVLQIQFALGDIRGQGTVALPGAGLHMESKGNGGFIERTLLSPWGRLQLAVGHKDGRSTEVDARVFAVHEASSVPAHRTFDRSVQLHEFRKGEVALIDYVVLPSERGGKPLGFIALRKGNTKFVAVVTQELLAELHPDSKTGYKVPWLITVKAGSGDGEATVTLTTNRLMGRKDDLAKLPYLARKAVGLLLKPFTFTLEGDWASSGAGVPSVSGRGLFRYGQVR
jgi:hypothetical protein